MHENNSRQIRIFISSTFLDMQRERDYLVKFTFPQLRKLCEERGVTWSEVDLRWGITNEQSAEGQVLPICLEEIQRCKPYFIGILGERYGWIPQVIDPALMDREPWLAEQIDHSVTELEILHGVLNNPEMAKRAFFYFRDPGAIPGGQENVFLEMPLQEEVDRFGKEEAWKRTESRREKLTALKSKIRRSGLPLKENFNSPQQLGEWVLQDLTGIIEQIYPAGSQPTPLQRVIREQEAFAESRTRVYVGGERYFKQIEEHLAQKHVPLALTGEPGIGKSALLANWGLQYRRTHQDVKVLMHFIGTNTASGDWAAILRRIIGELQDHFGLEGEIPEDVNALREAFPGWLYRAGCKGKVVLILDALNQLEDKQGAQELTWLPAEFPQNVWVILSTTTGKALDAVKERGCSILTLEPLALQEREEFVRKFLAQYSKQLNVQQLKRIVGNEKISNPLALRILLDELRQFGSYTRLDEIIQTFLDAESIIEMLELVFERCENDFETERPGLVKDLLCSIWGARQGLSEAELLDLLGKNGEPLAQGIWSPLHLALSESLLEHNGFIHFSHDYFRQAVEKHYLSTQSERESVHRRLADYFQSMEGYPGRKVVELPWQYQQAKDWAELYRLLTDADYFQAQWSLDRYELYAFWVVLEANTDFHREKAYDGFLEKLNDPVHLLLNSKFTLLLGEISVFFRNTGRTEDSMRFLKEQEKVCRDLGKKEELSVCLENQALILREWGRLEEAMRLLKDQEQIYREMGNQEGIQRLLGIQALILHSWGRFDEAMQMQQEKERICRVLGNKDGIQVALGNQALILKTNGKLEDAMHLYKEQELMCRELGNQDAIQKNLGNQGLILNIWGRHEEAMEKQKEKESICRKLGDLEGIQSALGNEAVILQAKRNFDEAMRLSEEKEKICLQIKNFDGLCTAWVYQGSIHLMMGHKEIGLSLLRKAYEQACQHQFTAMAAKIKVMLDKFS
jgi:tetratricopeptide (TPR) repeat protein